jgi:hypothetical protein
MTDWRSHLREAVVRLRDHYEYIGRTTAGPFLAIVYPTAAERQVLAEWRAQTAALGDSYAVHVVDALAVTHQVLSEIGTVGVIDGLVHPLPGSDAQAELGGLWIRALAREVLRQQRDSVAVRPVVTLTRLSALHPAAGPRALMQHLWDGAQAALERPVVLLIPGSYIGSRTYAFLDAREEFMYRGDLI